MDPIVGQDAKAVGRCIICSIPHDDYDNGYAPSDNKEARCCRCRVLVLVCNSCRETVRIWSQEDNSEDPRPALFCGNQGKECIDEGNYVSHKEIIKY